MCARCQEVLVQQQVIPALDHKFVDGICIRCGEVDPNYIPEQPEEPEIPEGIRGEIIGNELSMYSVTRDGELVNKDFKVVEFTQEEATQAPTESCFYQVKDDSGEIVEFGYQDMQIAHDEMYYIIALPKNVDYNSDKVSIKAYDDDENIWNDCLKMPLISDPDIVNALCEEAGVDISHINTDLYTVWVLEDTCSGSKLRYIITE